MKIKTRFAPSPTGCLHIGGARTALYSWLYARHNNGEFVLRIEDSDLERSNTQSIKAIIDSMNWLGIDWDEGPYYQTKRLARYNTVINNMLKSGTAYKCYCSKERLDNIRKDQISRGEKPRYDGFCRNKNYDQTTNNYVVRFSNPQDGFVVFNDQIRGPIRFSNQELDDLIIRRTDGSPTYNFCVVVDDWDIGITHIIRGEEHINNTPRQINIFKAIGAKVPTYAHISMIIDTNGKKLSKRHNAVDIMHYHNDGYLPEAILNYLVRLGWSYGDQEIFSVDDMVKKFTLNAVSKSASTFNINKLTWLNHYYINKLPLEYIAKQLQWHIKQQNIDISTGPELSKLVTLFRSRCKTLLDIAKSCRYFYEEFDVFNIDSAKKYLSPMMRIPLEVVRDNLAAINGNKWNTKNIHSAIHDAVNNLKLNISNIGMPLRIAITGVLQSPPLDVTIEAIGCSRSIERINKAVKFIIENE